MKRPSSFLQVIPRARYWRFLLPVVAALAALAWPAAGQQKEKLYLDPLDIEPRPIAKDASVKYDFDIVYVKTPRPAGKSPSRWAEVGGELFVLPEPERAKLVAALKSVGDDVTRDDPPVKAFFERVRAAAAKH